ncbi:hypothetical protein [Thalassomonas sp. RHCl1]|uniref:hypothetical protein n=1 Tax=Thalassomonas sp. RHCl1 TaxID=2995320 RepID=UPI00248B4628|nr:hypothetical protein [Thalassomonas sp. RHCl1]
MQTTVDSFQHPQLTRILEVTNTETQDTQKFCFFNSTAAQNAIDEHLFPENFTTDIRRPDDSEKTGVQFFTKEAFESKFKEFEVSQSGLIKQPSVFHESSGEIAHMLTPKMQPQSATAQLFHTHGITESSVQAKLSPGLEALHAMASDNDTAAVRSWIVDNANDSGTPDTRGLLAMVERAESTQNEKALSLIMGYARYEKCQEAITTIVDSAISEDSLSATETGQLLRLMDDILMQQYSFEADASSSGLVTLSTSSAESLRGDPVFDFSSYINGKIASGHDATELVDHLGVKSPKENINSLNRLWDKLDTPAATLKDVLDTKYVMNSTQANMFHSYVDYSEFDGGDGTLRDRLMGASQDDWALGMNRLLARLDTTSTVERMATEAEVGDINAENLSRNDNIFQQWLDRILTPIEFAYGDLSALTTSQKDEIRQTLTTDHSLFSNNMGDTAPVVLKALEAIAQGIDIRGG